MGRLSNWWNLHPEALRQARLVAAQPQVVAAVERIVLTAAEAARWNTDQELQAIVRNVAEKLLKAGAKKVIVHRFGGCNNLVEFTAATKEVGNFENE